MKFNSSPKSQLTRFAASSAEVEDSAGARSQAGFSGTDRDARAAVAARVLVSLSEREREALIRYYADRQDAETIQRDLRISEEEFRLIKARARGLFATFARKKPPQRSIGILHRALRA